VGIVVVILVIIAFLFVRNRLPQFQALRRPTPTPTTTANTTTKDKNSISVSTHTPSSTAVIDSVTLTNPGFVAVYESSNGQTGGILGSSNLLPAGEQKNLTISLSRKTTSGEMLITQVYKDNGDGKFDPEKDELIKDQNGNTVKSEINVSAQGSGGFQIPATGLGEDNE